MVYNYHMTELVTMMRVQPPLLTYLVSQTKCVKIVQFF